MTKISDQGYPRFYLHPVVFNSNFAVQLSQLRLQRQAQRLALRSAAQRYVVREPGGNPDIVPTSCRAGELPRVELPSRLFRTEEELLAHKFVLQDLS